MRIMFSVHVGDSLAMVFRTRKLAQRLIAEGHEIAYSVSKKAVPYLTDYLPTNSVHLNEQDYSYTQDVQEQGEEFIHGFYKHAESEMKIYNRFQPDAIIGDLGVVACAYNPNVPVLRILNRFYIEIGDDQLDSPFSALERQLIRGQTEYGINLVRSLLGVREKFSYEDFVAPPTVVNGASYFVDDLPLGMFCLSGMQMKLTYTKSRHRSNQIAFMTFGTGLAENRIEDVSKVLRVCEPYFKKIYLSYGTRLNVERLYQPRNAVMKPLFDFFPSDAGVIICHGGYGILHLGIQLGLPVVAIPFHIETFSNAYRLEKLRAGLNVGTYDSKNFKGGYEKFQVDWNKLDMVLENINTVQKVGPLEDSMQSSYDLLYRCISEFLSKLGNSSLT